MTWQRTDGTLLAVDAASHRDALEEYFSTHSIPVVLEFHPSAPYLVGVRLYVNDDGRVATSGANRLMPGLELEDLAEDIAERFTFDVLIGEVAVEDDEGEDEDDDDNHNNHDHDDADDACGIGVRVLTITSTPAEHLAALARSVGEPIVVAATAANATVLTEPGGIFPGLEGFDDESLPVVQLMLDSGDRTVVAHTEDYEPTTLTWGTTHVVVAGTPEPSDELRAQLEHLASDDDDARAIASATASADLDKVRAALAAPPEQGFVLMVQALGLAPEFAEFVEGERRAMDVPGAHVVEPAGPVAVLRSSLGSAVDDVSELKLVEFAGDFERSRPVAARSLSVAQGLAGAALLARAARSAKPWKAAGVTTGMLLLADALGELALYEWFRRRRGDESRDVSPPPA
ncbi:MAG: hypothetical protein ACQERF_08395 [Actinomycetota bacterium]